MSLTMFQASVPVCTQILGGLAGVLEKNAFCWAYMSGGAAVNPAGCG